MKKYIGVKEIEAKPLNLGDYNKYRGWQIPANEDPARDGYLVKYPDGYESWSPKEVFDEAYRSSDEFPLVRTALGMTSPDYKERFKAEFYQLKIRYDKLNAMVEKWDKGELDFTPTCPRETYDKQLAAMVDYLSVLELRANMEGVELLEEGE